MLNSGQDKTNHKRTVVLTVVGGLLAASAAAFGSTALASADTPTVSTSSSAHQAATPHVFPRNAAGLSYGSELDATSPANAPDLIQAYATNGKLGYVKKVDLHPAGPKNPAAALQAQSASNRSAGRQIPVFDLEGKTVIGFFNIDPGTAR